MTTFTDRPPECPACDQAGEFVGRRAGLDWWACTDCGHLFDTPGDADSDGAYPDW